MAEDQDKLSAYPIQMRQLVPRELYIKAYKPQVESIAIDDSDISLSIGYGEYDEEDKTVSVSLKIEIGRETEEEEEILKNKFPFFLRVEILGFFKVDEARFPIDRLEEWIKTNALFVLHPYLREQAYSLTARAGYTPLILPLVQVPTIKIPNQ
jgi:preprotein translocase subunit SecB